MNQDQKEEELFDIFNKEIARELIIEAGGCGSDEELEEIWSKCGNNPYDAGILFSLLKLKNA